MWTRRPIPLKSCPCCPLWRCGTLRCPSRLSALHLPGCHRRAASRRQPKTRGEAHGDAFDAPNLAILYRKKHKHFKRGARPLGKSESQRFTVKTTPSCVTLITSFTNIARRQGRAVIGQCPGVVVMRPVPIVQWEGRICRGLIVRQVSDASVLFE